MLKIGPMNFVDQCYYHKHYVYLYILMYLTLMNSEILPQENYINIYKSYQLFVIDVTAFEIQIKIVVLFELMFS